MWWQKKPEAKGRKIGKREKKGECLTLRVPHRMRAGTLQTCENDLVSPQCSPCFGKTNDLKE